MTRDVRVKITEPEWRQMKSMATDALIKTAHILQQEIRDAQVIPRAEGTLQGSAFYVDASEADKGYVALVHNTPYARRLYYHPEYNFRKDQNPNAQGMWLRHWEKGGEYADRPREIFQSIIKEKMK